MTRSDDDTCEFEFDPDDWEREHDQSAQLSESVLNEDNVWTCPHPAGEDGCCLFHRPIEDKGQDEVTTAFVEAVYDSGETNPVEGARQRQFIGAKFETFAIPYVVLDADDNFPIDLRHATVDGDIDWRQTIINHPVWLSGIQVAGDGQFHNFRIETDIDVSRSQFRGEVDFSDSTFGGDVWFLESSFGADLRFQRVSTNGDIDLAGTDIEGNIWLAGADIGGVAGLSKVDAEGGLLCTRTQFDDNVWVVKSTFEAESEENNYLSYSTFERDLRFRNATFGDSLLLRESIIKGAFEFARSTVANNRVDCTGTSFATGTFNQPDSGYLVYDCTNATVGSVTVEQSDEVSGFELLRLENTDFDGFEFGKHNEQLATSDWKLHTVFDKSLDQSNSTVETTYLRAKNGATTNGDNKIASRFFQKEMYYRRRVHFDLARDTDRHPWQRLKSVGRGIANFTLGALAGYGERPYRVSIVSFLVVAVFTGFFWALGFPASGRFAIEGALFNLGTIEVSQARYLVLSFQSFISLVYGAPDAGGQVAVQLMSAVEGFIGTFLIALLVFALTRSVHR